MAVVTRQRRRAAMHRIAVLLGRHDPISLRVVRRPFWIRRGRVARCYDARTLADYVRASGDDRDPVCRVPYTTLERLGLAWTSGLTYEGLWKEPERRRRRERERHAHEGLRASMASLLDTFAYHAGHEEVDVTDVVTSLVHCTQDLLVLSSGDFAHVRRVHVRILDGIDVSHLDDGDCAKHAVAALLAMIVGLLRRSSLPS